MNTDNITTIIFDAGGVLLYYKRKRNDIVRAILKSMGYELDKIQQAIYAGDRFDENYFNTFEEISNWREEKQWLLGHYKAIADSIDRTKDYLADKLYMLTFDTNEYTLYPEVIDILEKFHVKYKLGVISNALPSLDWAFNSLDIRKYFDNIIISAYERITKPSEEIYKISVERLGVTFEECIFVDDRIENVETAIKLGIRGFHLNRDKETLEALVDYLM